MLAPVVDLAQYRAAARPVVSAACRQHQEVGDASVALVRFCFAWQRVWLRTLMGM